MNLATPINQAPLDIFLQPGDFYFGDADTRIRTLLGSCVALTFWHPRLRVGGMCHYMLPTRGGGHHHHDAELDGRYADEAMALFLREFRRLGTQPREYQVKMFGGGNMFPCHRRAGAHSDVSTRNIQAGRHLLHSHGLVARAEHVGGHGHRQVIMDIASGDVWMRHAVAHDGKNPCAAQEAA
jgi:chemotaxis protein CheD